MKQQIKYVAFALLSVSGLIVIFMMDSEEDYDIDPIVHAASYSPPVTASVSQILENAKIDIEDLTTEEKTLRGFEYALRVSQLEAAIGENQNKARKLKAEMAREKVELENLKAEGKRITLEAEAAKLIAEAELRARESAKNSSSNFNSAHESQHAYTLPAAPLPIPSTAIEKRYEALDEPAISLNRISGDQATLTVNGRIGLVRQGTAFSGYLLHSIGSDRRSVLVKSVTSGKFQTLTIPSNDSRRFADPKPIGLKAKNGNSQNQNPAIYQGE